MEKIEEVIGKYFSEKDRFRSSRDEFYSESWKIQSAKEKDGIYFGGLFAISIDTAIFGQTDMLKFVDVGTTSNSYYKERDIREVKDLKVIESCYVETIQTVHSGEQTIIKPGLVEITYTTADGVDRVQQIRIEKMLR
jgi:hypothetical protein